MIFIEMETAGESKPATICFGKSLNGHPDVITIKPGALIGGGTNVSICKEKYTHRFSQDLRVSGQNSSNSSVGSVEKVADSYRPESSCGF
jgi:hypothetical protein